MALDPPLLSPFMNQITSVTWSLVVLDLRSLALNFSLTFGSKLSDLRVYKFMYSGIDLKIE